MAEGGRNPDVRFESTTVISSVQLTGETEPVMFHGALTGEIFKVYLKDFLVLTLRRGDMVIMDNISSRKVAGVIDLILAKGASVLFLPPTAPTLGFIENMWSKIKKDSRMPTSKRLTR